MIHHRQAFERSLPAGFDGEFVWDFLEGAFGNPKIKPMDFDGVVEINGAFLVFETKDPGKCTPDGQLFTLARTAQLTDFTVVHLSAKRPEEITGWWTWWMDGRTFRHEHTVGDATLLFRAAERWMLRQRATPKRPLWINVETLKRELLSAPPTHHGGTRLAPPVGRDGQWRLFAD